MKNIKSKLLLSIMGIISICAVLVFCLCSGSVMSVSAAVMDKNVSHSSNISFEVHNYEGELENTPTNETAVNLKLRTGNTKENYERKSFNWRDTQTIDFTMDTSKLSTEGRESYPILFELTWAPTLIKENQANFDVAYAETKTLIANTEYKNLEDIPTKFKLYFDETTPQGENVFGVPSLFKETYANVGGCWGIYLFTFTLGGTDITESSSVIEILPTDVNTLPKAEINVEKQTGSTQGLRNYYTFSINDERYNFVDSAQIKWFVTGKSNDGRTFVLEEGDGEEGANFIYAKGSILRNGRTFTFDPPYEGTWTVSYKIYQPDRATEIDTLGSEAEPVSTVKGLSTQSIIWIVVGAAAAAGIIVAIVIIVSIKREKVY